MKKLLGLAAMGVALAGLLVSCASTSGGAKKAASVHPRSYVLDPADGKTEVDMKFNDWGSGSNYQAYFDMWKFFKADKPQKGDTVNFKGRVTSDKDIPGVVVFLTDCSAAASYWTPITGDYYILDLKAGVPTDIDLSMELTTNAKGALAPTFAYDGPDHGCADFAKVKAEAHFVFEKVADTTDTTTELLGDEGAAIYNHPDGPMTFDFNLADVAKMIQMPVNASDGQIWNYQAIFAINDLFPNYLPKAGDTITLTWKGSSDIDINMPIMMTLVENTPAVGWWQDKVADTEDKFHVFAEGAKAGEEFTGTATFTLIRDCVEGISVQMYYEPFEGASGATLIYSRE